MSAWYIFTALGFYPLDPVSGEYMIGSPLFRKATLDVPNGRRLVVSALASSAANLYIQSAPLNGPPLEVPIVTFAQIEDGARLEFDLDQQDSAKPIRGMECPLT